MAQLNIRGAFDGESVFLTGFTGFVGKVLTEKLLRSCSNVRHVYVLMREKKVLEEKDPKFRHRIIPLPGDCSLPNLGLSTEDRQMLVNDVGIVFHGAATVRFDEQLKTAFNINIRGTREVLELAKEMKQLKGFIHVSTAYANCNLNDIDEKIYDIPLEIPKLEEMLNNMEDPLIQEIQPKLLGKWPNTYAFTKAIAEHVVNDYGRGIPRIIFRPAIVVGTDREPLKGWTDNLYGPTGLVVGAGCGLLHSIYCDLDMTANIIPVDYAVCAIIAAAAALLQDKSDTELVKVYNYVSSTDNPLKWSEFKRLIEVHGKNVPTNKAVWCYFLTTHRIWAFHFICTILFHYIPAIIMDTLTFVARADNPNMYRIYKKVDKYSEVLAYFSTRTWNFSNNNVHDLYDRLVIEDRDDFEFDITRVNWDDFFYNYIRGLRVYLLKEKWETLPNALLKAKRFQIAHAIVKYLSLALLLWFAWSMTSSVYRLITS